MKKVPLILVVLSLLVLMTAQYALGEQQATDLASVPAQEAATPTPAPEEEAEMDEVEEAHANGMFVSIQIPFYDEWASSPHADRESYSFNRWNNDDPAVIPPTCAKCHSTTGMLDYLGVDGSEALVVSAPAPVGTVVECAACHNSATVKKDSVVMPSGIVLEHLGREATCIECHQGRAAGNTVENSILATGVEDPDAINPALGFINIHYYTAAVSKFGTWAKGGYEYPGQSYDAFFMHVEGYTQCQDCHNPHSLELKMDECAVCHAGVETAEDLRDIRMAGSYMDYNGNGDAQEGIYYEIVGLKELLYATMQTYAVEVLDAPVIYSKDAHPYFFNDLDGDGEISEGEVTRANMYQSFSARLLRAAYNYQTASKDPGAYAHGGKYVIQLMHDSIADLNEAMTVPVDMETLTRSDAGHFAGSEHSWRYWDGSRTVPANCAKCHSATGLPTFLREGVNISEPSANGLACSTCHNDLVEYTLYQVESVRFPSGMVLSSPGVGDNLCMQCHQGRESGLSVARQINGLPEDEVAASLRFVNPHYFAAAATRYGAEAIGAYQYDGKEYLGYFNHVRRFSSCADCHGAHELTIQWEDCADCHRNVQGPEDLVNIREYEDDFDGDGDTEEGVYFEMLTMKEMLWDAIQAYAAETVGTPIVYSSASFPYYFVDLNGNGIADPEEINRANGYTEWTPRLLRAIYNYQYTSKDTGGYTHNAGYLLQVLYDTLEDLSVDVSGMVRAQ